MVRRKQSKSDSSRMPEILISWNSFLPEGVTRAKAVWSEIIEARTKWRIARHLHLSSQSVKPLGIGEQEWRSANDESKSNP